LPVMEEVKREAQQRKIDLAILPTAEAIKKPCQCQVHRTWYWSFHNLGDVTALKKGPNQGRAFRHSL